MNIIAWIILGAIAGVIAKFVYPGRQGGGFLATVVLGVIGAFLGGSLFASLSSGTLVFTAASLSIPGIFVAVLGAMVAIFLYYRFFQKSY
jgi:uncharacterized membrane protein YeaQ/YmgE (transglycosylase-associated protein family)